MGAVISSMFATNWQDVFPLHLLPSCLVTLKGWQSAPIAFAESTLIELSPDTAGWTASKAKTNGAAMAMLNLDIGPAFYGAVKV
jgi:hypothetical protein